MSVSIRYTEHGVPHITAESFYQLGRGTGWVNGELFHGLLADRWLTLRGNRSLVHGPEKTVGTGPNPDVPNLASDFLWRYLAESGTLQKVLHASTPLGPSAEIRELSGGFAEGYNSFLDKVEAEGTDDPRFDPETWLQRITGDDVLAQALHWNLLRSSVALAPHILAGAAPGDSQDSISDHLSSELPDESNMLALGAEATAGRRGMLYANPHWFWSGADSFREMHLRIPGVLDVYGSVVPGIPLIMTGFNEHLAFAGTSSLSPRFSIYQIRVADQDEESYHYEETAKRFKPTTVRCPVRGENGQYVEKRTFRETHHGLLLGGPKYQAPRGYRYAMREVGFSVRWTTQQLAVMTASSVDEADAHSARYLGVGWRNLAAADSAGDVLYADRTAIPNISDDHISRSLDTQTRLSEHNGTRIPVLDGSSADDEWLTDADAPLPGIIGVSRLPRLRRRDHVANENDSHWTNHIAERLEGYPQIIGPERTPRSLRTRRGLALIQKLLRDTDEQVDLPSLKRATGSNVVESAMLWKDRVVQTAARSGRSELADAAEVLRDWDGRENPQSRGAILWRRFFYHFAGDQRFTPEECFNTPFQHEEPITTPSGINSSYGLGIIAALVRAVEDVAPLGLDISVGEAQYVEKNGDRYPVPGGPHEVGQYNVVKAASGWVPGQGYPDVEYGTSYQLWVEFTSEGPVAESLLSYSQSDNPASEFYSDQTVLLGENRTKTVRFYDQDIARNTVREFTL